MALLEINELARTDAFLCVENNQNPTNFYSCSKNCNEVNCFFVFVERKVYKKSISVAYCSSLDNSDTFCSGRMFFYVIAVAHINRRVVF